jgi:hypothetical protein
VLRFDAIVGNLVTSGIEINGAPLGLMFVKVRYRSGILKIVFFTIWYLLKEVMRNNGMCNTI